MMRVLIADDELPARQRLRQLLVSHPELEVVAEAENGAQAMELAASTRPDLLLLDIQMPQGTGLDVAACLPAPRPSIIFCTAFDQYAVDAFELNAIDYLLKPVSRARLEKALSRLPDSSSESQLDAVEHLLETVEPRLSRFLVKNGSRYVVIQANDTAYFESVDGLTRLVTTTGKEYWMDPPLHQLESKVDACVFFRISRSALVNVNAIGEIHPFPGGGAAAVLKGDIQLDVSRRRLKDLLKALSSG